MVPGDNADNDTVEPTGTVEPIEPGGPAHAWAAPEQGRTGRKFGGIVDRINRWLVPYIGPPPLGPYNEAPRPLVTGCPLCGQPMAGHAINRDAPRTQLYCPS